MQLSDDTVQSVVEHMNADHSDACLLMVRAFTDHRQAESAVLRIVDAQGLEFAVTPAQGQHTVTEEAAALMVRIDFPKPLSKESQLRGMLIGMTKQARERLSRS